MATLKHGNKAPTFSLPDKDGVQWTLKDSDTNYTVVYFYPKDDTPGCTVEANGINSKLAAFRRNGIAVVGISGGNEKTKTKFCSKYNLKFPLLSDTDFSVSKKYKSFGKKKFMGREYEGIMRNTFVLDRDHRIVKIYEGVKPEGHAEEILGFVASQNKQSK